LRRPCLSETPSEARGDRARAVGGRRTAGNPVDSAGSGRASRRSRASVATRPHRPSGSRGEKRPSRRTIPEEESGTADLTLPVVGNDGAVRRLAGPPQLAPSPVGAAPAVLANPWPYGLLRSVSAASLSDVGCRVGDGGRAPQFAVPRGFGMKPTDTRVVQRTRGRERIDGRRTTLNLSSSSEFAGTTIPQPPASTPEAAFRCVALRRCPDGSIPLPATALSAAKPPLSQAGGQTPVRLLSRRSPSLPSKLRLSCWRG